LHEAFGAFIATCVSVFVAIAVAARLLTLWMRSRGAGLAAVLAIHLAGALAPVAAWGAFLAAHAWDERPPSAACRAAPIPVALADARFALPPLPAAQLFTEARSGVYSLGSPRGWREH
jgi:hypothetical protein